MNMSELSCQNQVKFKKSTRTLALLAAILLVLTIVAWGITSSWGNVRISRTEFVSNGGATMSGWMFVPKGVTDENPAPAIVDFHGRNTTAYNLIGWAIEQSRRGYVVFLPDQEKTNESLATSDNTTARIAISAVEYLDSQDFVSEVSAAGHSMGNRALAALIANESVQKKLSSIVSVGNMFMMNKEVPSYTNYLAIEAEKDFYAHMWAPTIEKKMELGAQIFGIENLEAGKLYGDPLEGTAKELLLLPTTHQQQMYHAGTIAAMMQFIEMSSPAPNPISYDNQIFTWAMIVLALCTLVFFVMIADLAYVLAVSPLFSASIVTERPAASGKTAKGWIKQFAMDFLIPIATFAPVTMLIAKADPTKIFRFGYVNQIFLWIFFVGLIGGVLLYFRYKKMAKGNTLTAADFGMGRRDEKVLVWKRIGNGFFIASITTFVLFAVLDIVCKVFGLNYQFFNVLGQLNRITPERFVLTIPYLVLGVILLVVININIATSRRTKDSGNETKDTIKDILLNMVLSAGPLTLLLAIQFIGIRLDANGAAPLGMSAFIALAYGLGFPLMMSASAGISTFLFRKTGNIWTGVFTSTFVLLFLTCNFGLITA